MRIKAAVITALLGLGILGGTHTALAQGATVCVKAHVVINGDDVVNEDHCETVEIPAP